MKDLSMLLAQQRGDMDDPNSDEVKLYNKLYDILNVSGKTQEEIHYFTAELQRLITRWIYDD